MTFGSIDDVSAPISSSPAAAPTLKSEGVKSFGSVPAEATPATQNGPTGHVNGKASISTRAPVIPPTASSSSTSTTALAAAAAATPTKPKIDIKKMFQNPTSAPPTHSETPSPSMRSTALPSQASSSHQSAPQHPPTSQLGSHSYTPFVPAGSRSSQSNGPNNGPPRSPQYSRQMPNGNGPRQGGPNGGHAGLSSPRLGPHPHPAQPSQMGPPPPMQPQMQPHMAQHMPMAWSGYYVRLSFFIVRTRSNYFEK